MTKEEFMTKYRNRTTFSDEQGATISAADRPHADEIEREARNVRECKTANVVPHANWKDYSVSIMWKRKTQ